MEEVEKHPNGFDSWLDTFFHITDWILSNYNENWNNESILEVKMCHDIGGHKALKHLAISWTNDFEKLYSEDTWNEHDFYDTLEEFCNVRNAVNS